MSKVSKIGGAALIGVLFVADEALLPVFHIFGIPIKISYLLAALWLILHLLRSGLKGTDISGVIVDREAKVVIRDLWLLIIISFVSEFILGLFTNVNTHTVFVDGITFFMFYIMCFGLGYTCYKMNPKCFLYVFYIYVLINIVLTVFYRFIPSGIYNFFIASVDYGDRARGTGGNPNTTLVQMNVLFMAIILMYKTKRLELKGINIWLVMVLPFLMNFVVSSRGEFIQTIILEIVYIGLYLHNQDNIAVSIAKVIGILLVLLMGYLYVTQVLYYQFDEVRVAINRIQALSNLTALEDSSVKQTSTVARPLIHVEEFWSRFKHSPILGCGYSAGSDYDFLRSANRYHNDIFKILASTGIVGGILWIQSIKKFFKYGGWFVITPFITSAITNTFIQSTHAINLYFFVFGIILHTGCEERYINE